MPLETPAAVKELLSPEKKFKDSIFKGTQLAATTQIPVAKRVALNLRWWVNISEDQMPVLRINKIGIHRVDDVVKKDDGKNKNDEAKRGEFDALKSMCFWMKREVDVLTRVNREMKSELEEIRRRPPARSGGGYGGGDVEEGVRTKKAMPSGGMKQWKTARNRSGGEEKVNMNTNATGNGKKEEKKSGNDLAIDVESELQRAIMAASAASS